MLIVQKRGDLAYVDPIVLVKGKHENETIATDYARVQCLPIYSMQRQALPQYSHPMRRSKSTVQVF